MFIGQAFPALAPSDDPVAALLAANPGVDAYRHDNWDLSTMFSDIGGTVPAVENGPVGYQLDKSGKGHHRFAANDAARPLLKRDSQGFWCLEHDGVDDALASAVFGSVGPPWFTLIAVARLGYVSGGSPGGLFASVTNMITRWATQTSAGRIIVTTRGANATPTVVAQGSTEPSGSSGAFPSFPFAPDVPRVLTAQLSATGLAARMGAFRGLFLALAWGANTIANVKAQSGIYPMREYGQFGIALDLTGLPDWDKVEQFYGRNSGLLL